MAAPARADWQEEDHPRRSDGKFGTGPGAEASTFRKVTDADWPQLRDADRGWSDEQKASVSDYSANGYTAINSYLRTGRGSQADEVERLDSAMSPTSEPFTVHRSMGWDALPESLQYADPSDMTGQTLEDKAYLSTSFSPDIDEAAEVQLEIEVPEGHPSIIPGAVSHYPAEQEMILARGTRLVITSAEQAGGSLRLKVRASASA